MATYEKLVVVTRRTRLEELLRRFSTRGHAHFYIERAGGNVADYEAEHDAYQRSLERLRTDLELGIPRQFIDRTLIPTYTFGPHDLVVALGQDGVVANVAKYAGTQPIVGVNPDPERFDGVLLPFLPNETKAVVAHLLDGRSTPTRAVSLAEFYLNDSQRLLAFNDLFIGMRGHTSARYEIASGKRREAQSSSGILVSTGAGSTGWMSSVFNMATGVTAFVGGRSAGGIQFPWEDPRLLFAVREPFVSRHSAASIVAGWIEDGQEIVIESRMPSGGVVFSDGVEDDYLDFTSGAIGRARRAKQRAVLVVKQS